MKYEIGDGFLLGSDICPEVLLKVHKCPLSDIHLADALHLPYRDESVDAALFVSVVHHFSSLERRRKALAEIASGQILIYAWAFEQPNGSFKSQDVLVPWHLHENPSNGHRLASLMIGIEEQLAEELSETILAEAIQEALSTLQKVTFYRFYHVFKKDELEELVAMVPSLRIISVQYDYANWCLLAEKCDPFTSHDKKPFIISS
uniref:Methyltransf_11 domain-containing protein n=1 Tax=Ascaris lumbricoides TaxID=6252 RepID=A0A0M3IFT0_ASCLU